MSVREVVMYRVVCDWPGCEASAQDATDYYAWTDATHALDVTVDADWRESTTGRFHYCLDHPATWAGDHEDGEPYPPPPYLLIHDGDTDDPFDDGKVTFMGPAS